MTPTRSVVTLLVLPIMAIGLAACSPNQTESEAVPETMVEQPATGGQVRGSQALINLSEFTTEETQLFVVSPENSNIRWDARKRVGGPHFGSVQLADGQVAVADGRLQAAEFVIDMTSITVDDLTGGPKAQLEGHLNSDDFFSTEEFTQARLRVMQAEQLAGDQYQLSGELTIKGITNDIAFPAQVTLGDEQLTATAEITVDRAQYDVRFGSESFFDDLGDNIIEDEFQLTIDLVARTVLDQVDFQEETTGQSLDTVQIETADVAY